MTRGKIIFLNGVSSSGKSTLAHALTKRLPDYFHFSLDDFDYIIEKMEDRGIERFIPIPTEYFYHQNVAMFADRGVNLILDHILHDQLTSEDFFKVLHDYDVLFVGVHCPVEELERREKARGDRPIGQGARQLNYVHKHEIYDIEVNTFDESIERCADRIVEALQLKNPLDGLKRTMASYNLNKKGLVLTPGQLTKNRHCEAGDKS